MNAELLLARLDGVRRAGKGWSANCPAHQDRRSSLAVSEGDDGRTLIHCFAGCPALDVVQAVGLTLADLFPERITVDDRPEQCRQRRLDARQHQWAAALPVLEFESRLVLIAANDILAGRTPTDDDIARLAVAVQRVEEARERFNPTNLRDLLREAADTFVARMGAVA